MAGSYVLSAVLELKDKFTSAIEGAKRSAVGFERTFRNVASTVQGTAVKINTGLEKIGSTVGKVGATLAKLGAASAAGIGGLGVYAIKSAADMEKYRNVLETVLKSEKEAENTMKWANNFANVTPFQNGEVIEGVVRLKSYGLDKESIQYIGDLASAMGKPLMQAVEAIADAQTGELERLKEFGITKNMIEEYSKQVGEGALINKKGQITDLKAFNIVLKELINLKFGGAMEKQADTFYGAISTSIGTMKSAMIQIAGIGLDGKVITGSMFDYIQQKVVSLSRQLVKMQEDGTLDRWTKKMGEAFQSAIPHIESAWQALKSNWSMESIETIIKGTGGVISGLGKTITATSNLIANFSDDGIGAFKKFSDDLPPVLDKALKGFAMVTTAIIGLRAAAGDPIAIAELAAIGGFAAGTGIGNYLGKVWTDFEKWKNGYDVPELTTNFETYQKDKESLLKWQEAGIDPLAEFTGVKTADILSQKYGVEMPGIIETPADLPSKKNAEKLENNFNYSPVININGSNLSAEEIGKAVERELGIGAEALYLKYIGQK